MPIVVNFFDGKNGDPVSERVYLKCVQHDTDKLPVSNDGIREHKLIVEGQGWCWCFIPIKKLFCFVADWCSWGICRIFNVIEVFERKRVLFCPMARVVNNCDQSFSENGNEFEIGFIGDECRKDGIVILLAQPFYKGERELNGDPDLC